MRDKTTRSMTKVHVQGLAGALIAGGIALACLLAPMLAPQDALDLVGDVWATPAPGRWLGLDNLGRDMLSRLLYGGRVTLLVALASTALACLLGGALGIGAAISGGRVDMFISRAVDAVMAIPSLIFALVLLSVVGTSIPVLIGTIALLASTRVYRLSHALAREIAVQDYFEAARLRRESMLWLAGREVLPNIVAPLITEFGLRLCSNFLLIASLSFLGLGVQPPAADWGSMVRENASAINFGGIAPLMPAAAIALFTIGVNLIVDWHITNRSEQHG